MICPLYKAAFIQAAANNCIEDLAWTEAKIEDGAEVGLYSCDEKECAWWRFQEKRCAVVDSAGSLSSIASAQENRAW